LVSLPKCIAPFRITDIHDFNRQIFFCFKWLRQGTDKTIGRKRISHPVILAVISDFVVNCILISLGYGSIRQM
jgi:hypothetical protein